MSRFPVLSAARTAALLLITALTVTACADQEQHTSARLMDEPAPSYLAAGEIEEGSTDADAPPRQQAAPQAATGAPHYQWNGNSERQTIGRPAAGPPADAKRPIRTPGPTATAPATGTPPDAHVVVVQPGDTLHGLADRHNVTVASLAQANRLTGAPLRVGQRIVLPPVAR